MRANDGRVRRPVVALLVALAIAAVSCMACIDAAFAQRPASATQQQIDACKNGTGDEGLADCRIVAPDTRARSSDRIEAWRRIGHRASVDANWAAAFEAFDAAISLRDTVDFTLFSRALAHYHLGRFDAALTDANEALRRSPGHGPAHALRAAIRFDRRDYAGALADANDAIRAEPGGTGPHMVATKSLLRLGRWREALTALDAMFASGRRLPPADAARAFALRAEAYVELGDFKSANANGGLAIDADRAQSAGWAERGIARIALGQVDEGLRDCTQAIVLDPSLPRALLCRADGLTGKGRAAEALADLQTALQFEQTSSRIFLVRGRAYHEQGLLGEAIADLRRASELSASAPPLVELGRALTDHGDLAAAQAAFNRAIELDPKDPWARAGRAMVFALAGDGDRGLADSNEAIRLSDNHALAFVARGTVYYSAKGDLPKALGEFATALSIARSSQSPTVLARVLIARGRANWKKNDLKAAERDFNEALSIAPGRWDALRGRGIVRYSAQNNALAIADLNEALAQNKSSAEAYAYRGFARQANGDTQVTDDFTAALNAYELDSDGRAAKDEVRRQLTAAGQPIPPTAPRGVARQSSVPPLRPPAETPAERRAPVPGPIDPPPPASRTSTSTPATTAPPPTKADTPRPPVETTERRPPAVVAAGERVALVIANADYGAAGRLDTVIEDARAMVRRLEAMGFTVIQDRDANRASFEELLGEFSTRSRGAEWALVYYAGHAMGIGGRNHLLPVDVAFRTAADAARETVPLERVIAAASGARRRMIMIDAGRANPFAERLVRAGETRVVTGGPVTTEGRGALVVYSAGTGEQVGERTGQLGFFAAALTGGLDRPGVRVDAMLAEVVADVVRQSGGRQHPVSAGSVHEDGAFGRVIRAMLANAERLTQFDFEPIKPGARTDDVLVAAR